MSRTNCVVAVLAVLLLPYSDACGNSPGLTHVYRSDRLTFNEAKASCQLMGARLAIANTEAEALLLGNLARYSQSRFDQTYVGRYYDGKTWLTTDAGLTLANSGYIGWRVGEPSYVTVTMPNGSLEKEACGTINWEGQFNDIACGWPQPYICEFIQRPCTKP